MKRSRRVVLTMMGSATIGAVSMGFARRQPRCGAGFEPVPGTEGQPSCRPVHYGGFGATLHHVSAHGHGHGYGHGHGHGGG
jgi:hypothetical protein